MNTSRKGLALRGPDGADEPHPLRLFLWRGRDPCYRAGLRGHYNSSLLASRQWLTSERLQYVPRFAQLSRAQSPTQSSPLENDGNRYGLWAGAVGLGNPPGQDTGDVVRASIFVGALNEAAGGHA